jgi:hypothetical protein
MSAVDAANETSIFESLKKELAKLDPVAFAENHLEIDGHPFALSQGSGYRYLAEVLRAVSQQAENKNSKPLVILKGRQVGATVMAAVISLYFAASGLYGSETPGRPPIRILHLFPTIPLMQKYSKDKLETMMRTSQDNYIATRSMKQDKKAKESGFVSEDTLTEKTFMGGNKIRIDAIGRDADRIRGLTQDALLFDEVQDMQKGAIENALRILTASQYGKPTQGVQMYFGTPKETGSAFWQFWNESDQRFYQLRCLACSEYFFLYTYGSDDWKKVWIKDFIVQCPHCECEQDKRPAIDAGRWMPTRDVERARYTGYHINLMLSPRFTKEMVMDFDPDVNPNRTERAWKNETLGEFYSSGGLPLTMEDIVHCSLDETRGISKGVRSETNKIYTLGIDWGGKNDEESGGEEGGIRGQSYTAMVVLSCNQEGIFTVENAFRLKKNDFTHRVKVVEELFNRYQIRTAAADLMFGNDVVPFLQVDKGYRTRMLGCINSGSLSKQISFNEKTKTVVVNHHLLVDEIFSLIKRGRIKFPVAGSSWDQMLWLMQHCASMEVKIGVKSENQFKRYVKGTSPNDGLMALMYAIIAYRFIATGGFITRTSDKKTNTLPTPVLAYAPKLR